MADPNERLGFEEDPGAQDVIDAMRIITLAQDDDSKALAIVKVLLEFAPETAGNRGIDLLLRMISEASLKVELVDAV